MGKKKKMEFPDGCMLSKKERKEMQKIEEMKEVLMTIWDKYVPKDCRLDIYAVPINAPLHFGRDDSPMFCATRGEVPGGDPNRIDNLNDRDWTREDIFEMMTDAERRGYDYLDNRAHDVKAGLPKGNSSPDAEREMSDSYEENRGDIIQMMIEFEAAIAGFLYAVNAEAPESVMNDADADLTEVLEMIELYGRLYEFEDDLKLKQYFLKRTKAEVKDLEEEIKDLEAGYEDAWTAIEDYSERYGCYIIDDEDDEGD